MNFRIADTFTDSFLELTNEEQKFVETTAFDRQLNPANPGLSFCNLDNRMVSGLREASLTKEKQWL